MSRNSSPRTITTGRTHKVAAAPQARQNAAERRSGKELSKAIDKATTSQDMQITNNALSMERRQNSDVRRSGKQLSKVMDKSKNSQNEYMSPVALRNASNGMGPSNRASGGGQGYRAAGGSSQSFNVPGVKRTNFASPTRSFGTNSNSFRMPRSGQGYRAPATARSSFRSSQKWAV
jgi:hypothetical protein